MLDFEPLTLDKRPLYAPYYEEYSQGSCQHSFVSSFCMSGKYGDEVCVRDGYLFTLRSKRCTDTERIYLFPLGNDKDSEGLKHAVELVLDDARAHNAAVRFETITEHSAILLDELFPGRFKIEENRDYAEYLYAHDRLAYLPGHEMSSKRHDLNTFERDFGGRYEVRVIESEEDIELIRPFQKKWLEEKMMRDEDVQLERENEAIGLGLDHFFELGMSGIIVFIDGKVAGYAYGAPLSRDYYDVIIEKGDKVSPDIYKILNRDLVVKCCDGIDWINREEDLGVEGLRKAKESYKPDRLITKCVAWEVR